MDNRLSLPDEGVGQGPANDLLKATCWHTGGRRRASLRAWEAQFPALGPYPHAIGSPGLGSAVSVQALAKGTWPSGPPHVCSAHRASQGHGLARGRGQVVRGRQARRRDPGGWC